MTLHEDTEIDAVLQHWRQERSDVVCAAFHRAWTACVGTPLYDKSIWKAAERQLIAATKGKA